MHWRAPGARARHVGRWRPRARSMAVREIGEPTLRAEPSVASLVAAGDVIEACSRTSASIASSAARGVAQRASQPSISSLVMACSNRASSEGAATGRSAQRSRRDWIRRRRAGTGQSSTTREHGTRTSSTAAGGAASTTDVPDRCTMRSSSKALIARREVASSPTPSTTTAIERQPSSRTIRSSRSSRSSLGSGRLPGPLRRGRSPRSIAWHGARDSARRDRPPPIVRAGRGPH